MQAGNRKEMREAGFAESVIVFIAYSGAAACDEGHRNGGIRIGQGFFNATINGAARALKKIMPEPWKIPIENFRFPESKTQAADLLEIHITAKIKGPGN